MNGKIVLMSLLAVSLAALISQSEANGWKHQYGYKMKKHVDDHKKDKEHDGGDEEGQVSGHDGPNNYEAHEDHRKKNDHGHGANDHGKECSCKEGENYFELMRVIADL